MSFDSGDDGYVAKLLVSEGTASSVGVPVLVMVEEEEDIAAFANFTADAPAAAAAAPEPAAAAAVAAAPAAAAAAAPVASGGRIFASPIAKVMAREAGLGLEVFGASGQGGRITKADVQVYLDALANKPAEAPAAAVAEPAAAAASSGFAPSAMYTDIPLTNVRKIIAGRLLESKQTIPHYYLSIDCEMDALLKTRATLNGMQDTKVSVNDFIIKASALAMKSVPEVNSSWMDTFIRENHTVDISIAVSTPNGLITPIVFDANAKGLATIAGDVKELAGRAREGGLQPHEFQGGTFTISNLGMFGVKNFSAIVNPPQSCILAVGGSEKRVVPDPEAENGLGVATVMSVTLSCDHRVVDGAVGAAWLNQFKTYIEDPLKMLL
jgi:pyruvate dehydrogenase E2 component (dihydrolipoamide acetyltransferase)